MKIDIHMINEQLQEAAGLMQQMAESTADHIYQAAEILIDALQNDGKILLCGNGGSAADCQHIATELVVRYRRSRAGFAAIALTTDTSVLTAAGNDLGFECIFKRQVEALGRPGDVLIAISTSGTSPNVLIALKEARLKKMKTVVIIGENAKSVADYSDVVISVPSTDTPRIQEAHHVIGHILCDMVEQSCSENK
jgi:D-sedoheptulose 7-phosphate isomerase